MSWAIVLVSSFVLAITTPLPAANPSAFTTIGVLNMVGIPFKFSDTPAVVKRAPPTLGQHTGEVLKQDLGMDDESIQSLREQKII